MLDNSRDSSAICVSEKNLIFSMENHCIHCVRLLLNTQNVVSLDINTITNKGAEIDIHLLSNIEM